MRSLNTFIPLPVDRLVGTRYGWNFCYLFSELLADSFFCFLYSSKIGKTGKRTGKSQSSETIDRFATDEQAHRDKKVTSPFFLTSFRPIMQCLQVYA